MGDGKVALILDVVGLAQKARVITGTRERALTEKAMAAADVKTDRQTMLLFATRDGGRMAIPLSRVARLEEFPSTSVERAGAVRVVQYRDEILPLFRVSQLLTPDDQRLSSGRAASECDLVDWPEHNGRLQVVVCGDTGRHVGLVVDRILDICEEAIVSRSRASRSGILFTAVIQGRVTEFLDMDCLVNSAVGNFGADQVMQAGV
jgi:two-component system chemotaxis sensor kinase CheA